MRVAGADTIGMPGIPLRLHRIAADSQGVADSAVTGPGGAFRVRFPSDTTALFLLSASYSGIEYLSRALPTDPARPDTAVVIVVADTSAAQPVNVVARQLVITAPEDDGTRSVVDLITLENPGPATRVGRDSMSPSWAMPLPAGIRDFAAGPETGELLAIEREGESLVFVSPIPPGVHELLVQYVVPAGVRELPLPLADSAERLDVLFEEEGGRVDHPGVAMLESRDLEGRTFYRWSGAPGAGMLRIVLPATGTAARWALAALVTAMAVGLGIAAWLGLRGRGAAAAPAPPQTAAALADAAAELDARYAGREADTPPDEWRAYQAERARLKEQIAAALAAERRRA